MTATTVTSSEAGRQTDTDLAKRYAAARALELIRPGMVVGLGTGSTAEQFMRLLGEQIARGLAVIGVATSRRTEAFAADHGIPLRDPGDVDTIHLTVDGADEVDAERRLIKGGGGALLGEKIVAAASERMLVVIDAEKLVPTLGRFPLPVEVVPFGWKVAARQIAAQGSAFASAAPQVRRRRVSGGEEPYITDAGHYILDCAFGAIHDPVGLAQFLEAQPGIVEHGLFIGMADAVVVGRSDGADVFGIL